MSHKMIYCTLGLRGKNFLSVSLKSHKERSSSVSPRKLLRPNVSLCHTERFRTWDFRYSILTLYCYKKKANIIKKNTEHLLNILIFHQSFPYSENLIVCRIQGFLLHSRFSFSQIGRIRNEVTLDIPRKGSMSCLLRKSLFSEKKVGGNTRAVVLRVRSIPLRIHRCQILALNHEDVELTQLLHIVQWKLNGALNFNTAVVAAIHTHNTAAYLQGQKLCETNWMHETENRK